MIEKCRFLINNLVVKQSRDETYIEANRIFTNGKNKMLKKAISCQMNGNKQLIGKI